jgi:hypothetical protein
MRVAPGLAGLPVLPIPHAVPGLVQVQAQAHAKSWESLLKGSVPIPVPALTGAA